MVDATGSTHFETPEQQATAARLGMWAFLASETLLFAGLFGLYAAYRVAHPAAFAEGVGLTSHVLGAVNTFVLLTSSLVVALALAAVRADRRGLAVALVGVALVLGAVFLSVKGAEYLDHIRHGIVPGGRGAFFRDHPDRALRIFVTLYYVMTALHGLHVVAGMTLLAWLARSIWIHHIHARRSYPFELGALYWHLVDVIWVFLWPIFYLTGGAR